MAGTVAPSGNAGRVFLSYISCMWKLKLIAMLVVVLALVPYAIIGEIMPWLSSGSVPLQVSLVSEKKRTIQHVSAAVLNYSVSADEFKANQSAYGVELKPVNWQQGSSFTVAVNYSGRRSLSNRYRQDELLVLCLEYSDGKKEYVTAALPDVRKQSELVVKVPSARLHPNGEKGQRKLI